MYKIEESESRQGIRIYREMFDTTSPVSSIYLTVYSGSNDEPKEIKGISHYIEHLKFKPTIHNDSIANILEDEGISINAYTNDDVTVFYADFIYGKEKLVLDILMDMMFFTIIDDDVVNKERNTILEEYNGTYDESMRRMWMQYYKILYNDDRMYPTIGTEEGIKKINANDIKKRLQLYYRPNNMAIFYSGKSSTDDLAEILNRNTFDIGNQLHGENVLDEKEQYIIDHANENPYTMYELLHPYEYNEFKQPDSYSIKDEKSGIVSSLYSTLIPINNYKERLTLLMIDNHLSSGLSSVFFKEIREYLGNVYLITSTTDALNDKFCEFFILFKSDKDSQKTIETRLREVMSNFVKEKISEERLSILKNKMSSNLLKNNQSSYNRASRIMNQYTYADLVSIEESYTIINTITKEDVDKMIDDNFNDESKWYKMLFGNVEE